MSELPINLELATASENSRIALAELTKLEERIKTLEAFHHWATTQVFMSYEERLQTIQQQVKELWQVVNMTNKRLVELEAKLEPQTPWTQQQYQGTEQERVIQTLQHIANHPPFQRDPEDPNRFPVRMPDYNPNP